MADPVIHACPSDGSTKTSCCGWSVNRLPLSEPVTVDYSKVTCRRAVKKEERIDEPQQSATG